MLRIKLLSECAGYSGSCFVVTVNPNLQKHFPDIKLDIGWVVLKMFNMLLLLT